MVEKAVLDSNIFISSYKGNEKHSRDCTILIKKIEEGKLILVEPTILLSEVIDAIGRYIGKGEAKKVEKVLVDLVGRWIDCDKDFCIKAGHTGYNYNIYGCDAIYVQTAADFNISFISLDIEQLVNRLKRGGFRAHSVTEFLSSFKNTQIDM